MIHAISVRTKPGVGFQDITEEVQEAVSAGGVESGMCFVFVPHTTAAITLNENADPAVLEDIAARLEAVAPQRGQYHHSEGNGPAHVKASLVGNCVMLLVDRRRLVLGTWQGVFLCEFDGPRDRKVLVKVVADAGER